MRTRFPNRHREMDFRFIRSIMTFAALKDCPFTADQYFSDVS